MQENRKSELRPVLWVEVDKPKIEKEEGMKDFERNFVTSIRIFNYSGNPAIKLGIEIVIPWKEEENSPHYASHRPRKDAPGVLGPQSHYESLVNMYMHVYDYIKYADGFLSVKISYEDMDRNRYSFEQLYDLQVSPFQEKIFYYLPLKYEALYYNPSFMGKSLHKEARAGVSKEDTFIQIFKRGSL
jgi:hypothetical protein